MESRTEHVPTTAAEVKNTVATTTGLPEIPSRLLRALVAIELSAMMGLIFVDVILRYLFNAPIPGGFEIIQFLLALLIFSAMPLVAGADAHIVVSIFEEAFTGVGRYLQRLVVLVVSAGGIGLVGYLMWQQAQTLRSSEQSTGYLELPMYLLAYAICALVLVALGVQLMMLWKHLRLGPRGTRTAQ